MRGRGKHYIHSNNNKVGMRIEASFGEIVICSREMKDCHKSSGQSEFVRVFICSSPCTWRSHGLWEQMGLIAGGCGSFLVSVVSHRGHPWLRAFHSPEISLLMAWSSQPHLRL